KNAPTTMNARITVTLMATMMLFTVADSETPSTSNRVTASVMNTAGMLNNDFTTELAAIGTTVLAGRCITESGGNVTAVPAASSRRCPVAGSSALVPASSTADASAFTVTSSALVSAYAVFPAASLTALTTSYWASWLLKVPVTCAESSATNCTSEPSASLAVTPLRLTTGSTTLVVETDSTTYVPLACVIW